MKKLNEGLSRRFVCSRQQYDFLKYKNTFLSLVILLICFNYSILTNRLRQSPLYCHNLIDSGSMRVIEQVDESTVKLHKPWLGLGIIFRKCAINPFLPKKVEHSKVLKDLKLLIEVRQYSAREIYWKPQHDRFETHNPTKISLT